MKKKKENVNTLKPLCAVWRANWIIERNNIGIETGEKKKYSKFDTNYYYYFQSFDEWNGIEFEGVDVHCSHTN